MFFNREKMLKLGFGSKGLGNCYGHGTSAPAWETAMVTISC